MRRFVWFLLALALAVPAAAQTGRVSAGNSTTAVLGSGATFTGAWEDATQAAVVVVTIKADQASATNGVKVEFSSDGINQDFVSTHTYSDTTNGQTFADAMASRFVRVEFVNGAAGQATFRLQTVVRDNGFGGASSGGTASSVTINDPSITTQKAAVNASGQLSITCANCSGSGASAVDESTFTQGTNSVAPAGILFKTGYTALTSGQVGVLRGFSDGSLFTMGNVASGAADVGNPLKFGVVFNTTQPTVTTGQRVDVQGSARGEVLIAKGVSGFSIDNSSFGISGTLPAFASTPAFTISGTLPAFAATPTFNLGTLNGAALDGSVTGLEVTQGSTTSGQKGIVVQGAVTTNAPTYTTAQTDPLSLDTGGLLRVSLKDTPQNTTAFKVDGSAVTQPISAASLPLPTLAATSTKQSDGSQKTQIVDGSGNVIAATSNALNVQCANCSGSGASAVDNATITEGTSTFAPAGGEFQTTPGTVTTGHQSMVAITAHRAFQVTFFDASGNAMLGSKTSANSLPVVIASDQGAVPISGSVTANLGTLNGAALDASVTGLQVAQGSTTSGQKGDLVLGAVTTNAPTYTTAQSSPLSLDAAGLLRVSLKDTPANTTALKVDGSAVTQPVSGTVTANQGGTWTVQPGNTANTTAWKVDGSAVTQPVSISGNQPVNVAQVNGVTPLMGAGATGTGAQRVNDVASSATGAAPPASATYVGGLGSGATGGFLIGPTVGDTGKVINVSTATTTLMITGVSGRQVHITAFHMITAGANNVAWLEGTGATCGTGTAGMAGGTTAASGYNFAANGGIAMGTGIGDVMRTATTGDSVCLITSAAVQLSGFIEYAIY